MLTVESVLSAEPAQLFDTANPDWAPSLHLGYGRKEAPDTTSRYQRYKERKRKRAVQAAQQQQGTSAASQNQAEDLVGVEFGECRITSSMITMFITKCLFT